MSGGTSSFAEDAAGGNRGMPILERYPLFQLVSSMPATKVAAQYGISSNALRKTCKAIGFRGPLLKEFRPP